MWDYEYQNWWNEPYEPTQEDNWSWEDRNYAMWAYQNEEE